MKHNLAVVLLDIVSTSRRIGSNVTLWTDLDSNIGVPVERLYSDIDSSICCFGYFTISSTSNCHTALTCYPSEIQTAGNTKAFLDQAYACVMQCSPDVVWQ